jgi:osmotically-inducible protein OsmY
MHTDERIKSDVVAQLLADHRLNAANVQVTVERGFVTLTGSVPSAAARASANTDAWSIRGVTGVDNGLTVQFPPGATVPADSDIADYARNVLSWTPYIEGSDIHVSVQRGVVRLAGQVDAYWKRIKSEELLSELRGVAGVENNLVVVPTGGFVDTSIAEGIAAALDRNHLVDAGSVTVKVDKGSVTLSGAVPSWAARLAAHETAAHTYGVTDVINEIVVSS